ncbi:MAG: phytanoyl-CoA dioxygenase family protein [Agriterribacter sp.]
MFRFIKRIKAIYILYNLFQKKKLQHNAAIYKKIGLKKQYFSSISSKDFKNLDVAPLYNNQHIPTVSTTALFKELDESSQKSISNFNREGYAIIKQYLSTESVDAINSEIEKLLEEKKVGFKNGNKIMFAIHVSNLLKSIGEDKKLLELLSSLINHEVKLFQSINFVMGSEQHTHSDSIHMTTYPLGGLLGVWIALEDIDEDNGPLHYYPGSHTLPYYLNSDYDNEGNWFLLGSKYYTQYEKMLEEKIQEKKIQKKIFTAKKGDLLIWHANLLHGGEPHSNKNKTRRSMVYHYFAADHICYHEITQRPALIH